METAAQNPLEIFFLGVGAQVLYLVPGFGFSRCFSFAKVVARWRGQAGAVNFQPHLQLLGEAEGGKL